DNVRIQDITVRNPLCGPNTDVLDIDCSENVIISGCDIIAGDDCIALKSDTARLGEDKPCRNIAVTNCVFTAATCGVRIGYEGDGAITDCVFSNLVINDTKNAIDILSLTPLPRPDYKTGTPIERISFSNITMRNVSYAFHVWCGTENEAQPYAAHISDLTFANITALTRNGSIIVSKDGAPIRNVFMNCVRLIRDEHPCLAKCVPCDFPDVWGGAYIPEILKLHRIENIRMDGVVLESAGTVNPLSEGAFLGWTEVKNAVRDNVRLPESGSMPG
ncbi:MAG: hypothetical protein J6S21_06405, partial [Victivallales bacterium]|nr:hypothetical protein [Victivallales bacterium]